MYLSSRENRKIECNRKEGVGPEDAVLHAGGICLWFKQQSLCVCVCVCVCVCPVHMDCVA